MNTYKVNVAVILQTFIRNLPD